MQKNALLLRSLFLLLTIVLSPVLSQYNETFAKQQKKYWIYFTDKGSSTHTQKFPSQGSALYAQVRQIVQPRALARRAKVLPANELISIADVPVHQPYIDEIINLGGSLHQTSRWLNAASFMLTPEQLTIALQRSFVKRIAPVIMLKARNNLDAREPELMPLGKTTELNYGPSLTQVQMINVPAVHDCGITGKGVLVGMLDTGFRWKIHESLSGRRVIAEYDFINHDSVTANELGDASSQDQHGTLTMSTLGGYAPGKLIGPAFDADFILGKTEYVPSETRIEEDNWAAGIEWMEAQGVDVVSSSLGYNTFDAPEGGYTWANGDFNGRTSVTAQAAIQAARLGVLVVDAMGNEGNGNGSIATMLTPADADSIISVGAVSFSRFLASFSSTGPTNDGRTKPDVVSPGVGVYCASTSGPTSYFSVSGTSLATPMTGGAAALVLSARPELTPVEVRNILRNTADTIDMGRHPILPNNFTGWGLVNALQAVLSSGPVFSNVPAISTLGPQSVVNIHVVSKYGIIPANVILYYAVGSDTTFNSVTMSLDSATLFPTSGRYSVVIPSQLPGAQVRFFISATDSAAHSYQSPAPVKGTIWQFNYGITDIEQGTLMPSHYELAQNYPNPFNPSTTITYVISKREYIALKVYDVLGRVVSVLVDEIQDAGTKQISFDAGTLPSGVYFYRLETASFFTSKKMILLR